MFQGPLWGFYGGHRLARVRAGVAKQTTGRERLLMTRSPAAWSEHSGVFQLHLWEFQGA